MTSHPHQESKSQRVSPTAWTDPQLEELALTWRARTDAQLAEALADLGPAHTAAAIEHRRLQMGFRRPRGFEQAEVRAKALGIVPSDEPWTAGWPSLSGSDEERERRYLRLLFEGLSEEARRISARAPAQQEAA